MAWLDGLAGVGERGMCARVPQEPGRSRRSRTSSRYRRAKETKRGGRDDETSERLVVPAKRGNRPEGPRGGKRAPGHGIAGGKDEGDVGLHHHLNET